jgi:hypothetical protein
MPAYDGHPVKDVQLCISYEGGYSAKIVIL